MTTNTQGKDGGLIQYLFLLSGVACIVVSFVNLPNHKQSQELSQERNKVANQLAEAEKKVANVEKRIEAFNSDPSYRLRILRKKLRQPARGSSLQDHLKATDPTGRKRIE